MKQAGCLESHLGRNGTWSWLNGRLCRLFIAMRMALLLLITCGSPAATSAVSVGASSNLTGEGSVSRTGSFNYRIPLPLPEGVDGLQPELWLQYDSQSPNGLLGRSFTLGGLPSVTRCGKTKRQDGDSKAPNLTVDDRFCYDGARLVLDSAGVAPYGGSGATYRTEFDQFARVVSTGTAGDGPLTFVVNTKAGHQHTFGGSADSRHMLAAPSSTAGVPTAVLAWSINETRDFIGNSINYQYSVSVADGSQYIDKITYNAGRAYVKFEYEADGFPSKRYVGGGLATRALLLKAVRVYVLDDNSLERLVRRFSFGYAYGDVRGDAWGESVAMLKTVTHCGSNDVDCLAPLTFNWAATKKSDAGFTNAATLVATGNYPGMFSSNNGWTTDVANPRRFADLNRDGILDIVGIGNDGVYAALSDPRYPRDRPVSLEGPSKVRDQFGFQQFGWGGQGTITTNPKYLIDMNRDGYADVVGISDSYKWNGGEDNYERGLWISYWNPSTSNFEPKVKILNGEFYTAHGLQDSWGDYNAYGSDIHAPRYLLDMNKDGYPDVVGFDERGVWVSFFDGTKLTDGSNGQAKFVSSAIKMRLGGSAGDWSLDTWLGASNDNTGTDIKPIYMADMNADGYPDIVAIGVGGTFVLYWLPGTQAFGPASLESSSFRGARRYETIYPVQVIDMNGDSLPDLVQFGGEGVRVSLWTGTSFAPLTVWTTEFRVESGTDLSRRPWRLADVDGDGFPDLVAFADEGVRIAPSNGSSKFLPSSVWTTDIRSGNSFDIALKTPRHVVDLDGDGVADIVGFSSSAVLWAKQKSSPGPRIIEVQDSSGAKLNVLYTVAQKRSGFYLDGATPSDWPVRDGAGSTVVVAEIAQDVGTSLAGSRVRNFLYEGRKFHFYDGPLGFKRIWERDSSGIRTLREFGQEFPFIGALNLQDVHIGGNDPILPNVNWVCMTPATEVCFVEPSGRAHILIDPPTKLSLSKKTWTPKTEELGPARESPTGFKRLFAFAEKLVEERSEVDGTALPTRTTIDQYAEPTLVPGAKQWGNRTQQTVTLSTGESTKTTDTFEPADEAAWKIGRLKRRVVEAQRPAKTVSVAAPTDAPPPPGSAGPTPISPAVLSAILQLLLED